MTALLDLPGIERGRHDKEGRQRALVDAAIAVFAESGYEGATTREVAARAGCSEGLIHRYFGGKRGLLFAVLEQRAEVAFHGLSDLPLESDLAADLRGLFHHALGRMWEERNCIRVSIAQAIVDPEVGAAVGRLFSEARIRAIAERLERHRAAGRVARDADLIAAAVALAGIAFSGAFMLQVVFAADRGQLALHLDAIAALMARALAPAA